MGGEVPVRLRSFPQAPPAEQAAETQLTRLTHQQYVNTVRDLFGIGYREPLDLFFAPDALNGFNFDTSNNLQVDSRLGPQYRRAAEELAAQVVGDTELFESVVPCSPDSGACAETYLSQFGQKAFRRPLEPAELAEFTSLFERAGEILGGTDPFRDGVQLTLEALLQSPQFLYRTESNQGADPGSQVALSSWEIASRLSYFLLDSMPDDELFALAEADALRTPQQVATATRRLLTQPRVLDKLFAFHEQAWQFGKISSISPDRVEYPNTPSQFVARARLSAQLFVEDVLANGGGLEQLLTAPYAFVDEELAELYGVEAPGPGMNRIDFPEGGRRGLLMQVGFLASNAYAKRTDPIHRGLFVVRQLLCREVPSPPPSASMSTLPDTDQPLNTTRDEVDLLTSQSGCARCHTQINAAGFAFEGFDAVGQARSEENGFAVNTVTRLALDGQLFELGGAQALVGLLARSEEAHRCYSRRLIEFAQGRPLAEADLPTWDEMASQSLPLSDLIEILVTSPPFLTLTVADSSSQQEAL